MKQRCFERWAEHGVTGLAAEILWHDLKWFVWSMSVAMAFFVAFVWAVGR